MGPDPSRLGANPAPKSTVSRGPRGILCNIVRGQVRTCANSTVTSISITGDGVGPCTATLKRGTPAFGKRSESLSVPRLPTPPPRRVVLTNDGMDLDIALLMVTRALGRSYARLDLFEAEEIPINDLEHASQVLRDGRQANALDDFQSASLLAALTQAVETSGVLLHQIGAFTTRERPKDA